MLHTLFSFLCLEYLHHVLLVSAAEFLTTGLAILSVATECTQHMIPDSMIS